MRRQLMSLAVAASLMAACGGDGSPSERGVSAPPWGLDSVATPLDRASIAAAFEALPPEIEGLPRTQVEPLEVGYGAPNEVFVRAIRVDDHVDDDPSAVTFLDDLANSGEVQIEARALDPESALVYVVATGTEDRGPAYFAAWGAPDSDWLFSVNADTSQLRAALAEAFVEAVDASAVIIAPDGHGRPIGHAPRRGARQ